MNTIESFYQDLQNYLKITSEVIEGSISAGDNINKGDNFKIRVILSNNAKTGRAKGNPKVVFNDAKLTLTETKYAKPTQPIKGFPFENKALGPKEETILGDNEDIWMESLDAIPESANEEPIAISKIWTRVDLNDLFLIRQEDYLIEDIVVGG